MYKHASRTLQRRTTRIVEVRPDASTYVCADDILSDVGSMTRAECIAERSTLLLQKTQAENELRAMKRAGATSAGKGIGYRIQSLCTRLSEVAERIKTLDAERRAATFEQAAFEVLSSTDFQRVRARMVELQKAVENA